LSNIMMVDKTNSFNTSSLDAYKTTVYMIHPVVFKVHGCPTM
jgi:hypothetical protein